MIDFKLPNSDMFECLTEDMESFIINSLKGILNNDNDPALLLARLKSVFFLSQ